MVIPLLGSTYFVLQDKLFFVSVRQQYYVQQCVHQSLAFFSLLWWNVE